MKHTGKVLYKNLKAVYHFVSMSLCVSWDVELQPKGSLKFTSFEHIITLGLRKVGGADTLGSELILVDSDVAVKNFR